MPIKNEKFAQTKIDCLPCETLAVKKEDGRVGQMQLNWCIDSFSGARFMKLKITMAEWDRHNGELSQR